MNKLLQSILLVTLAAACSSAAQPEQPKIGDTFRARTGEYFRGWLREGAGLGRDNQNYALLRRGDAFIVALTLPVSRDSRGGVEVERITNLVSAKALPGEEEHDGIDCGWSALGRDGMPVIAFYNPQNGVVRGYFAAKGRIFVARWTAKREDCQYHSD